jgi:hypothetical protein
MEGSTLPTTAIALIGFITVANLGAMGVMLKYFLGAQKKQTEMYMLYIQTKNGHLESARKDFGTMLQDQGERHRKMLDDAALRLERLQFQQEGAMHN